MKEGRTKAGKRGGWEDGRMGGWEELLRPPVDEL